MKTILQILAAILIFALIAIQSPSLAAAQQSPLAMVRTGTDQIVSLLKATPPGESLKSSRLRTDVASLISAYVDFEEMSSRALGRYWKQQSPEKRLQFVGLFKALFCSVYMNNLEGSDLAGIEIQFEQEKVEDRYALVVTHVKSPKHPPVSVQYRLILKDQCWKVYDVVVEGVSFVSNYRSQFSSLLDREPFDSILKHLEQKVSA